ncbi:MAG: alpha/beta fold hydrolase [Myxococcota bacterium]
MAERVEFPAPRPVRLPDRPGQPEITLSVHEQGEGTAVVFSHGFPELGYSWRYQLPAVAAAGFRAIAPDQRGYGKSTCPARIEDYGLTQLTGDLVGLLDALEIERAIFCGHDWGGMVAWAMPVLHPDRVLGVAGVCTPYMSMGTTELMRAMVGGDDDRLYILWFQEPGKAESVMDPRARFLFERMLRTAISPEEFARRTMADGVLDMNPFRDIDAMEAVGELIVSPEELDHYVTAFEETGFRGGIHWYRNIDRNSREHPEIGSQKLELPCLMITAEWDGALRPEMAAGMPALCRDLEMHMIERAGHWVQQERPEELNRTLTRWLRRRF